MNKMILKPIYPMYCFKRSLNLRSGFIILALFFSFKLQAQETVENNKSISLRGKAFTTAIIEDIYFQNLNTGVEWRFAEKHSVGFDFVHFRWRFEDDIYLDGEEKGYGPDSFSRRRYLLIDYRYYPFRVLIKEKHIDPYLNPFVKVGERKIWTNDASTFFSEHDIPRVKSHRADFIDYGAALGFRYKFKEDGRVGIDVNIGAVYRETRVRYEQRYDSSIDTFSDHYFRKYHNWHPHMRLNIFVKICKLK
jgi:hypothetical protein